MVIQMGMNSVVRGVCGPVATVSAMNSKEYLVLFSRNGSWSTQISPGVIVKA